MKGRKNYSHKPIKTPEVRCKSVKEKKISIKDLKKVRKQYIENPVNQLNFQIALKSLELREAISHLIKAGKYQYEMLIALQKQIICLEAKIKLIEANLKRIWGKE
jgi:hypothetical protein